VKKGIIPQTVVMTAEDLIAYDKRFTFIGSKSDGTIPISTTEICSECSCLVDVDSSIKPIIDGRKKQKLETIILCEDCQIKKCVS